MARETDFGEEAPVDEEDGNRLAVAPGEIRIRIHVHVLPMPWDVREDRFDLAAHLLAEVAAGPGKKGEPRQGADGFFETR